MTKNCRILHARLALLDSGFRGPGGTYWCSFHPELQMDLLDRFYESVISPKVTEGFPTKTAIEVLTGGYAAVDEFYCCLYRLFDGGRDLHGRPGRYVMLAAFLDRSKISELDPTQFIYSDSCRVVAEMAKLRPPLKPMEEFECEISAYEHTVNRELVTDLAASGEFSQTSDSILKDAAVACSTFDTDRNWRIYYHLTDHGTSAVTIKVDIVQSPEVDIVPARNRSQIFRSPSKPPPGRPKGDESRENPGTDQRFWIGGVLGGILLTFGCMWVFLNNPAKLTLDGIENQTVNEGTTLTLKPKTHTAGLKDGNWSYSIKGPPGISIDDKTGVITWKPDEEQGPGEFTVTLAVQSNLSMDVRDEISFIVKVNEVNQAPTVTKVENQTVTAGQMLSLEIKSVDFDKPVQALYYVLKKGPVGAKVDAAGKFTWTVPESATAETQPVEIVVADAESNGKETEVGFSIAIQSPPSPAIKPVVAQVAATVDEHIVWRKFKHPSGAVEIDMPAEADLDSNYDPILPDRASNTGSPPLVPNSEQETPETYSSNVNEIHFSLTVTKLPKTLRGEIAQNPSAFATQFERKGELRRSKFENDKRISVKSNTKLELDKSQCREFRLETQSHITIVRWYLTNTDEVMATISFPKGKQLGTVVGQFFDSVHLIERSVSTDDENTKVPLKIREYFQREEFTLQISTSKLEVQKKNWEIALNRATPQSKDAIRKSLSNVTDSLSKLKKSKVYGLMPGKPSVGDIGAFSQVKILQILDASTVIVTARTRSVEGNGGNHETTELWVTVGIASIDAREMKVGQDDINVDLFRVVGTSSQPSDLMRDSRIKGLKNRPDFVVEAVKREEIEKYRANYKSENHK